MNDKNYDSRRSQQGGKNSLKLEINKKIHLTEANLKSYTSVKKWEAYINVDVSDIQLNLDYQNNLASDRIKRNTISRIKE